MSTRSWMMRSVPMLLSLLGACTSSEPPPVASEQSEIVSTRLACKPKNDPCEFAGEGQLAACLERVYVSQTADGKLELTVALRGAPWEQDPSFDVTTSEPKSLDAGIVKATFSSGEHAIELRRIDRTHYNAALTVGRRHSFALACEVGGAAPKEDVADEPGEGGCTIDGRFYAFGARYPSGDRCNTCVCGEGCTELACAP